LIPGKGAARSTDGTSSGSSANRHVTIINNTGATIERFYGSNAGSTDGTSMIPPGVDVCTETSVTFN
jgi:hypothetical protein